MGRGRSAVAPREVVEEVPVGQYLAKRRQVPHLFEIGPEQLAAAQEPAEVTSPAGAEEVHAADPVTALASLVRARGDRETDVCLLVDDGERFLELAHDLADNLRRDVYLPPHGAAVRFIHEVNAAGEIWEAVAVDLASGGPAEWLVVRPQGLPTTAATWFTSVHGRLRRVRGLVTVALPDGVAFATRVTYRDTAQLAARLMPSGHPLTTLAANAELGLFEIARFEDEATEPRPDAPSSKQRRFGFHGGARDAAPPADEARGTGTRLRGTEFAALVRATLHVIHPDVQVALTWPKDATACATLHTELQGLADALDRTVWVPEPQGAAFVQTGFGEFVAVDEVGSPSRWRAYPASSGRTRTTLFGTDLDGRLAPLGEVSGARFTGVPFVSVPAEQLDQLRPWYAAMAPPPGLFAVDLGVLPDGRLGVRLSHGVSVVAGARELRELLREAGWRGEELLLLAQPSAHVWNNTIDHARGLVEGLRTDLWLATLGAEVWVQADGTIAAAGPAGSEQPWCCVAYGRTAANVTLPPALQVPQLIGGAVVTRPEPRAALPGRTIAALPVAPYEDPYGLDHYAADLNLHLAALPAAPVSPGLPALPAAPRPALPGPTAAAPGPTLRLGLGRVLGAEAPHAVPWLPASPAVNPRPTDLYLWTPQAGDRAEAWTLPSAELFLLAGQDPLRLAEHRPTGHLLRLRVPERAAVEVVEHLRTAPAGLQERLAETGNTHLLPLAWLSDLRVTARFDLDGAGGVRARRDVGAGELAIRFEGAEHGVPGLPNEVVHWPDKGSRADAPCYLLLPDESHMSLDIVHGGFVALSRRKPALLEGHRLIEVRVRRRLAIDVPATLDTLTGMPVAGRIHDFVGLDLLLPETHLEQAAVTKIWRRGPGNRVSTGKLGGESLYDALLDESILTGRRATALTAA